MSSADRLFPRTKVSIPPSPRDVKIESNGECKYQKDGRDGGDKREVKRLPIEVTKDQYEVNEQAMRALAQDGDLYHRGGELVHIIRTVKTEKDPFKVDRPVGTPQIRILPAALLRE